MKPIDYLYISLIINTFSGFLLWRTLKLLKKVKILNRHCGKLLAEAKEAHNKAEELVKISAN